MEIRVVGNWLIVVDGFEIEVEEKKNLGVNEV